MLTDLVQKSLRVAARTRSESRPGRVVRRWPRFYMSLLILLTLSFLVFGTHKNWPYKVESDGRYYYQFLVSLFFDRDLDFTNNYRVPAPDYMYDEIDLYRMQDTVSPVTQRPTNYFTIGPALFWSPFFVTAYVSGQTVNALFDANIDLNPWGLYLQYATMYSGVLYALVTLVLLLKLLTGAFASSISKFAVLLILFATNLYYYTVFEPSMSHVYDLFTYVLLIFLFQQIVSGNNRAFLYPALGLVAGLHVLVRTQNVVTCLVFAMLLLLFLVRQNRGLVFSAARYAIFLLVFGLVSATVLFVNLYLYADPFVVPQGTTFLQPAQPRVVEVLFSLRNGLFSHHPVLLVGLVGFLIFFYRKVRFGGAFKWLAVGLLAAFLMQLYINSIAFDWWGGNSFGQRRFISSLPLFAFGLAEIFTLLRNRAPRVYFKFAPYAVLVLCLAGVYLALIHVFLWKYDQPHNIVSWMFYEGPRMIASVLR